ncbi:MAG TPA: NAD(P)/FAD-dependent oxidoreductase [Conexibacter sp.]|jgi:cation diffusion facilitator CzcD-associated flavoprotein CzcO
MPTQHTDVLIVGAGLSGVGAACHLKDRSPGATYKLLESRGEIGGTWDLFRYPGIRSDSDMHTLGYSFRPWRDPRAIADGPSILRYVRETAAEYGVDRHIQFNTRVLRASWSSDDARWTVEAKRTDTGEPFTLTCSFLMGCSGYYDYESGYTPQFEGVERFRGQLIHPQQWPEDVDYAGKRVVVIGSGATAVTLVPSMARDAAHVTMLQRSPSYVLSVPTEDPIANAMRRRLPDRIAFPLMRWKNVMISLGIYQLSRRRPELVKKLIRKGTTRALPPGFDVATHFRPRYNPWDQRLCLVPDGDLFRSISDGNVSIATDQIETFDETGIALKSGVHLDADVIVTATGLNLLAFGGIELAVDGEDVSLPETMAYKGMMLSDVPNFAFTVGYTNASWTLKADLVAEYVCRLLNHMRSRGWAQAMPERRDSSVTEEPFLDFQAGYVQRAVDDFPRQGSKAPWRLRMNYAFDLVTLRFRPVDDEAMRFGRAGQRLSRLGAAPKRDAALVGAAE